MLRYVDGFETYATADLGLIYTVNVVAATIVSPGRYGGNCLLLSGAGSQVYMGPLSNQVQMIVGFAIKVNALPASNSLIFAFGEYAVAYTGQLQINTNGTVSILKNGTAITGGTSSWAINPNVWYYMEFKYYVSSSIPANSSQLNVNGVNVINLPTGTNTQVGSLYSNIVNFNNGGLANMWVDDFYIADSSGSLNNDFLGPQRVEARFPNANGANTAWTFQGGATAYQSVKEQNQDGDASFITSNNINDISTFPLPALSDPAPVINGLQVRHVSAKGDASTRQVADVVRSNSVNYVGTTSTLTSTYNNYYRILETDPNTGSQWTAARANSLEAGVKVIA